MACVVFKLTLSLYDYLPNWLNLTFLTIWVIMYVEAHWLFCWHYFLSTVLVQRSISFDYELDEKPKLFDFKIIELGVSVLIVVSFSLSAIFVDNYWNSLWYDSLILGFQSISLICLTIALIRIHVMI